MPRGSINAPRRSGSRFVLGLHIVYRYKRFSLGRHGARGQPGNPASIGVATKRPALKTCSGQASRLLEQPPASPRKAALSLIGY